MERIYNKLVRDKIPNIIKEKGETPVVRILDEIEYKNELEKKLYEEYKEVIRALANLENKNLNEVIAIADKKNEKRGAFEEKIFLEKVIERE